MPISLPPRPVMGAVILYPAIYDEAKRLGVDLTGYIRGTPIPVADRKRAAARKKLADWAKRGGAR